MCQPGKNLISLQKDTWGALGTSSDKSLSTGSYSAPANPIKEMPFMSLISFYNKINWLKGTHSGHVGHVRPTGLHPALGQAAARTTT